MSWYRLFTVMLILVAGFLFYQLLWSDNGIFNYLKLKEQQAGLEKKLEDLEKRTIELSREIRWLKSDKAYIERVIRKEMNYLKENETLYLLDNSQAELATNSTQGVKAE